MSLLDTLDPLLLPWAYRLLDVATRAGVHPRVTSARRTRSAQEQLYKTFLAGKRKYPAAAPGSSAHEYGFAFDMVVEGAVNQRDLGVVWVSWGGRYYGDYDPVHFEYPNWQREVGIEEAVDPRSGTPPSTGGSISDRILGLADEIVRAAPSPLRGILNTAVVANALTAAVGNPYAPGVDWLLSHPAEVTEAFVAAGWRSLLGR